MVNVVTNLGRTGLQDWLLQRVSAVLMAGYVLLLLAIWVCLPVADLKAWHDVFAHNVMRCITFVVLLAVVAHAWIGMWIISTDYVKIMWLRLIVQASIYSVLIFYLVWGLQILWG